MIDRMLFSGGSIRGIAHIGAIHALQQAGELNINEVVHVVGSSAGSLVAMMVALRLDSLVMREYFYQANFSELIDVDFSVGITNYGLNDGKKFSNYVEGILVDVLGNRHVTFQEMFELTGIRCTITGTCLTDKTGITMDHLSHPHLRVATAVRISTSMPLIFTPVKMNNKYYLDGSLTNDYPIEIFDGHTDTSIGCIITSSYPTEFTNHIGYLKAVTNLCFYQFYGAGGNPKPEITIAIDNIDEDVSIVSFHLSEEKKKALFQAGLNAARSFLTNKLR